MKLISGMIIFLLVIAWIIAPIPPSAQHIGAYNYTSHLMYCKNRLGCLHEIGHRLDQKAGYISQSKEFYKALEMYLYVELRKPNLSAMPADILELTYQHDETPIKCEIYAYLFAWADGKPENMPESLRKFYDWNKGAELIKQLHSNQKIYWLN